MPAKNNSKDICHIFCFNKNKVNKIKKAILPIESLRMLSEVFKAISDVTRLKIILALKDEELCVCDISHILGVSLSAVSHQLRILRNLKLVKYRSQGKMVFYSLADRHTIKLIKEGITRIIER